MIIGISGKINSGKDTIGKIIQILYDSPHLSAKGVEDALNKDFVSHPTSFEIKKFADKLKNIVCLLIDCNREQLEDREFKERELGDLWTKYIIRDIRTKKPLSTSSNSYISYEEARKNIILPDKHEVFSESLTPRLLLQLLGTECGRKIIHPNIWVNALMVDYKTISSTNKYPNWIITDVRFSNELQAVKDRKGITIRVNRFPETIIVCRSPNDCKEVPFDQDNRNHVELYKAETSNHESETALDNADFDYTIDNNKSINHLVSIVREIMIEEKLINKHY